MNRKLVLICLGALAAFGAAPGSCTGGEGEVQPAEIDVSVVLPENHLDLVQPVVVRTRDGTKWLTLDIHHKREQITTTLATGYSVALVSALDAKQQAAQFENVALLIETVLADNPDPATMEALSRDLSQAQINLQQIETNGSVGCSGTVEPGDKTYVDLTWTESGVAGFFSVKCDAE